MVPDHAGGADGSGRSGPGQCRQIIAFVQRRSAGRIEALLNTYRTERQLLADDACLRYENFIITVRRRPESSKPLTLPAAP